VTNGTFLLDLTFSATRMEPALEPLRDAKISVATIDTTTGLFHQCVVPPHEKKPELCHMAIEAGLMIVCHPVLASLVKNALNSSAQNPAPSAKNALKKNPRATPAAAKLSALRAQAARNGQKLEKRAASSGENADESVAEQEAISTALREMQLQAETLEAAQQALGLVQKLESDYFATPAEDRTPMQYNAIIAAYGNARAQLALQDHHSSLVKTAMTQAQLSSGGHAPLAALGSAVSQQMGLQSKQSALPVSVLEESPGPSEDAAPAPATEDNDRKKKAAESVAANESHVPPAPAHLLTETPQ